MRKKKLPNCYNKLFPILLFIATLFMGTAYASVNATDLAIVGDATAVGQDGLFITEAKLLEHSGANISNTSAVAYQTMLDSSVELSPVDSNSYVTFQIKLYNSFDYDFNFWDAIYDSAFYDNNDIVYTIDGLNVGDSVNSKTEKQFTITFKYGSGVKASDTNNILNAYLNFSFMRPVEYIESSGTQYIDTGIIPDNTTNFNITFAFNTVYQDMAILGSRTAMGGIDDKFNLWLHAKYGVERHKLRWDYNDVIGEYLDLPVNEWKKINVIKGGGMMRFFSNGQSIVYDLSNNEWRGNSSIYVFNQNQASGVETRRAIMKLYDLKIYKLGDLVRDFIPVLDQNGKACLFDKITHNYFYNMGSGDFGYGTYDNIYNYVQNNGSQYIDLEIKPDNNTEVQFVMALDSQYQAINSIFGAMDSISSSGNAFSVFLDRNSFRWDYSSFSRSMSANVVFTEPTFILLNSSASFLNSVSQTYDSTTEFNSSYNMYLYSVNGGGTPVYINQGMKIYYFKVLKNGEVVRNLVPSVDTNGVACFYDLVSKRYFYNKGSGKFIVG